MTIWTLHMTALALRHTILDIERPSRSSKVTRMIPLACKRKCFPRLFIQDSVLDVYPAGSRRTPIPTFPQNVTLLFKPKSWPGLVQNYHWLHAILFVPVLPLLSIGRLSF